MFDAQSFRVAGENIFIHRTHGASVTYSEACDRIDEIATTLADCKHKVCLFFFHNDVESIFTYLAMMRIGCIPMPLPPDLSQGSISNFLNAYACEFVVGRDETLINLAGRVRFRFGSIVIKSLDHSASSTPINSNCALLLATSGSTGDMKAVRISRQNIKSVSSSIVEYLQVTSNDIFATSLPLFYSYGLSVLHAAVYCHGALAVQQFSLLDKKYWKQLALDKVTVFSAVPAMLDNMSKLGFDHLAPTSLKILTVAGGRLSNLRTKDYLTLSSKLNFSLFSMYGATEASPRMSYVPPQKGWEKLGSAGIPIPGGSFSVDAQETDQDGEVIFYGPNVALGYATCRSDLNKDDDFQGRLRTGDIGYLDDDGFLHLTGRLKRISKQQGVRLNLDHVESILSDHSIEGMAVDIEGQLIIVTSDQDTRMVKEILRKFVSRTLKFRILTLKNLPHNANGKRDYKVLVSMLEAGAL